MNRLLTPVLALIALALGALPAQAVTISYSTSGSNAQVFLTPTSTGDIGYPPGGTFTLKEVLDFGNTSGGHYGQAITLIPFTLAGNAFFSATVSDLALTDAGAKPLSWLTLALYEYTGSGKPFVDCASGAGPLCTEIAYDPDPPTASIGAALLAGTQYVLRVGFGLCGCNGDYAGINLTVTTTPIPGALLLFVSALLGMGGVAWRRRNAAEASA
jgi:hypothetical protein